MPNGGDDPDHPVYSDIDNDAMDIMFEYRYRKEFQLSAVEFANEPFEAIQAIRTIWLLKDERDKLEAERAEAANG